MINKINNFDFVKFIEFKYNNVIVLEYLRLSRIKLYIFGYYIFYKLFIYFYIQFFINTKFDEPEIC